jgi:hypothetical protein
MIQGRDRPSFLLEAPQPVSIARKRFRQNLDRHIAVETRVTGAVHLSHAAGTERRLNLIWAKLFARG